MSQRLLSIAVTTAAAATAVLCLSPAVHAVPSANTPDFALSAHGAPTTLAQSGGGGGPGKRRGGPGFGQGPGGSGFGSGPAQGRAGPPQRRPGAPSKISTRGLTVIPNRPGCPLFAANRAGEVRCDHLGARAAADARRITHRFSVPNPGD